MDFHSCDSVLCMFLHVLMSVCAHKLEMRQTYGMQERRKAVSPDALA